MLFAQRSSRARRAFTLVELLTVIVIIGILAGLVTAAAIRVQGTVKKTAHALELKQLEMALHAYKERFGEFPPDGGTPTENEALFKRHVRKAFPRCDANAAWVSYGQALNLNPQTSLTFWLGGIPDSGSFTGFSADPTNPFKTGGSRIGPFYSEFDYDRLKDRCYYPTVEAAQTNDTDKAIRYYRAVGGEYNHSPVAFKDSNTSGWVNPRTFQILSPGLRGGSFPASGNPLFPNGPYTEAQLEMMSNFTGGTMEDALP